MARPRTVILWFAILALADSLMAYVAPINYRLQTFSLVSHFYFLGVMVYVTPKPALTRLLVGTLAGLAWDFLFAGTFPWGTLWFAFCAWLSGLMPLWTDSTLAWTFYTLLAFLMDLLPYLVLKAMDPGYPDFFSWLYKMELFTTVLSAATAMLLLYGRDVLDRYRTMQRIQTRTRK